MVHAVCTHRTPQHETLTCARCSCFSRALRGSHLGLSHFIQEDVKVWCPPAVVVDPMGKTTAGALGNSSVNGWNGLYRPEHEKAQCFQLFLLEFHRYGYFRNVRRRPEHDVKLLPVLIAIDPMTFNCSRLPWTQSFSTVTNTLTPRLVAYH